MPKKMGFYYSPRSQEPKVFIHQAVLSDWSNELRQDVIATIAIVWLVWLDTTVEFEVAFLDDLPGTTVAACLGAATYNDDPGVFQFARNPLARNRSSEEFRSAALKAAAHEATHAVQFACGESPTPGDQLISDVDILKEQLAKYQATPSEVPGEAEATVFIAAVKAVENGVALPASDRQTRYSELWREYKAGKRLWKGRAIGPYAA